MNNIKIKSPKLLLKEVIRKPAMKLYNLIVKHSTDQYFLLITLQYIEIAKVRYGIKLLRQIRALYGETAHVFLVRGATGDVYLVNCLIKKYCYLHKIDKYVMVGDGKGLREVSNLFFEDHIYALPRWKASCLQSVYKLCGEQPLNMTDLFMWQHSLYFNRCRLRMEERFNFMDTYQWYVFGFSEIQKLSYPPVLSVHESDIQRWNLNGISKGRTVVISPHAYSVECLDQAFWRLVVNKLKNKGYNVVFSINTNKETCPFPGEHCYFANYEEIVPMLNYAGFFIAVRSGLCDIVSQSSCKMVILYPMKRKVNNYNEHRSDIDFAGLKAMGLNKNAIEIETRLLKNKDIDESGMIDIKEESFELTEKIVACF